MRELYIGIYLIGYFFAYRIMKKELRDEYGHNYSWFTVGWVCIYSLISWCILIRYILNFIFVVIKKIAKLKVPRWL